MSMMITTYQYLVHKVLLHVHNVPLVWPIDHDHEQTLNNFPNKALPIWKRKKENVNENKQNMINNLFFVFQKWTDQILSSKNQKKYTYNNGQYKTFSFFKI